MFDHGQFHFKRREVIFGKRWVVKRPLTRLIDKLLINSEIIKVIHQSQYLKESVVDCYLKFKCLRLYQDCGSILKILNQMDQFNFMKHIPVIRQHVSAITESMPSSSSEPVPKPYQYNYTYQQLRTRKARLQYQDMQKDPQKLITFDGRNVADLHQLFEETRKKAFVFIHQTLNMKATLRGLETIDYTIKNKIQRELNLKEIYKCRKKFLTGFKGFVLDSIKLFETYFNTILDKECYDTPSHEKDLFQALNSPISWEVLRMQLVKIDYLSSITLEILPSSSLSSTPRSSTTSNAIEASS